MQKNFLFRRTGVIVTLFALILGFACNISFASTPMQRELKVYVDDREVKFPDAKPYIMSWKNNGSDSCSCRELWSKG